MKIDFSKVISMDKSQETFDRYDEQAKGWILSNSDMHVVKRRQQEDGSVVIWAGIIN